MDDIKRALTIEEKAERKRAVREKWSTLEMELERALGPLMNMRRDRPMFVPVGTTLELVESTGSSSTSPRRPRHELLWCNKSAAALYSNIERLFDTSYMSFTTRCNELFPTSQSYADLMNSTLGHKVEDNAFLELEFQLLHPVLEERWCLVSRASNVLNVKVIGRGLMFLHWAHIEGDNIMRSNEYAKASSKLVTDLGMEIVTFSIQVSMRSDIEQPLRVSFFGVIGGPIQWKAPFKLSEIQDVDAGIEEDQRRLLRDGRFPHATPETIIDIAILRMSFILRAVSTSKVREHLRTLKHRGRSPKLADLDEELFEGASSVVPWLRNCRDLLSRLMNCGHPDVLIDAPDALLNLLVSDESSVLDRKRVQYLVQCLLDVGLQAPIDDSRWNSRVRHIADAAQLRRNRESKLRLLHMATRDFGAVNEEGRGICTHEFPPFPSPPRGSGSVVMAPRSASMCSIENETGGLSVLLEMRNRSLHNLAVNLKAVQDLTGSTVACAAAMEKRFDGLELVDKMVEECLSREGDSLSANVFAARVVARE